MNSTLTKERREELLQGCRDVLAFRRAMAAREDAPELSLRILGGKVPTPTTEELLHLLDAAERAPQLAGITSIQVTIGNSRITIEDNGEGRFYAMRVVGLPVPRFLIAGRWYDMHDESAPDRGAFNTAAEALAAVHAALATEEPAGA